MISVCMATYNGELFIKRQLDSILSQLSISDEVIISDDSSTDSTLSVIKEYADSRIRLFESHKFASPIRNFEFALNQSKGDYIFLSDQDDEWYPGKIQRYMETFRSGCDLVISNCRVVDQSETILHPSFFELNRSGPGFWHNIIKNSYLGCCMAISKRLLHICLPFPSGIPMHDWWIGLIGELTGTVAFIEEPLMNYRRHGRNASLASQKSTISLTRRLLWRFSIAWDLLFRINGRKS